MLLCAPLTNLIMETPRESIQENVTFNNVLVALQDHLIVTEENVKKIPY